MTWTDARTLRDLGKCVTLWHEGKLPDRPTREHPSGNFNAEKKAILPILTALNLSGEFICEIAQPACTRVCRGWGGTMDMQRAGVTAFVSPSMIDHVCTVLDPLPDVKLQVTPPSSPRRQPRLLVSRHHGKDAMWYGQVLSPNEIAEHFGGNGLGLEMPGLDLGVISLLKGCYQVTALDRRWGRNGDFWRALRFLGRMN